MVSVQEWQLLQDAMYCETAVKKAAINLLYLTKEEANSIYS